MESSFPSSLMMYPMMGSVHFFGPTLFLGMLSHLAIVVGIVLLLAWAIKHLKADQLKRVALWCIGAGIILAILTCLLKVVMPGEQKFMMKSGSDVNMMMKLDGR